MFKRLPNSAALYSYIRDYSDFFLMHSNRKEHQTGESLNIILKTEGLKSKWDITCDTALKLYFYVSCYHSLYTVEHFGVPINKIHLVSCVLLHNKMGEEKHVTFLKTMGRFLTMSSTITYCL